MSDVEIAQARAAMRAPVTTDPEVLGAVGLGLLAVPVEPDRAPLTAPVRLDDPSGHPQLAVRRRD